MKTPYTIKQILSVGASILAAILFVVLVASIEVRATDTHTQITQNLSVSPLYMPFGVVFPEEILYKDLLVALSSSFMRTDILDDVEYHIEQKIKPRVPEDAAYCQGNPFDYSRCYPTLCPYISKEADLSPANDTSVPAFHDPNDPTSIAYGRLAKSDLDIADDWMIDLHVPCFEGECAQDNVIPKEYEIDPALMGVDLGCDLKIVVDHVSYRDEKEGTIGFWKNWNKHKKYTQTQINGWLATVNISSGWIMSEMGYSANTSGMVSLINDSTGCNGSTRACAKKKFAAQYMVTRLNVLSGRKQLGFTYALNAGETTYLGLTSPATLLSIFNAAEGKLPDIGNSPTRAQFLIMQGLFNRINNTGF